jgi:molecular chaperone GrpE (heat shock protein)
MAEDLSDIEDAADAQDQAEGEDVLAALKAENAALKDQALRYAAEAENIRRRTEREANDARAYAIQKFARDLLDAADNLSRALRRAGARRSFRSQPAPGDDGAGGRRCRAGLRDHGYAGRL